MLLENTLWAVQPLAEKLEKSGITLVPYGETPLSALINASDPTALVSPIGPNDSPVQYFDGLLKGSSYRGVDGLVKHDVVMDEVVKVIARTVGQNLDVARNQVNPIIKKVVEDVQKGIGTRQASLTQKLAVVPDFFASIWDSPVVDGMVNRYTETPVSDAPMNFSIEQPVNIEEALRSGAGRFDEEIKAFLDTLPIGYAAKVWDEAFNGSNGAMTLTQLVNVGSRDRDAILILHLFARRMLNQVPEGVRTDLSTFRDNMASVVEQSGRAIARILEKRQLDLQRKNLVISYPSLPYEMLRDGDGIIRVNGVVYNQWLEAGGKPEALFGAFLSDKMRTYDGLLTHTPELCKIWEREERVLGIKARSDAMTNAIASIRDAITSVINDIPEDQLMVSRSVMHERLMESLTYINAKRLEDIYTLCRKIVCRVIFPHTDAEKILNTIDELANANPEMEIREVALLATVDVVTDWICQLFKVDITSR